MDIKRRLALATSLLAVCLGAGHLVQSKSAPGQAANPPPPAAQQPANHGKAEVKKAEAVTVEPRSVEPLQATLTTRSPAPAQAVAPQLAPQPVALGDDAPAAKPQAALPLAVPAAPAPEVVVDACKVTLDLSSSPAANIGVTLLAPCHKEERVVLRHAGLAITAKTSLTGALFIDLPALEVQGAVDVRFGDGTEAKAVIEVPEAGKLARFGVQWMEADAFQLHAFEGGADYGQPGHVSAETPHLPLPGAPAQGGYMMVLGDASVDMPMQAAIYTFPRDGKAAEVVVESQVTEATCGRELIGETLTVNAGSSYVTDLTLAMPGCDAMGDILVLKNLVPEMKLAAN